MNDREFRRDNHFVSRGYLKRWASDDGRVWAYRCLVSRASVPLWKRSSPKGIAYHEHLYTRTVAGGESDEIEKWLEREFETPAEEALRKATAGERLSRNDWRLLARFLAAQDVRTPARFQEQMTRWDETLPGLVEKTLTDSVRTLEEAARNGAVFPDSLAVDVGDFPMRIRLKHEPGDEMGQVGAEILSGRKLWLWGMQRSLEKTITVLEQHRWTILAAPPALSWFTSDNPVIRLNFVDHNKYDFKGGWGSPGTDIMLPLGPRHLLHTRVGHPRLSPGESVPVQLALRIRRVIAEHAHRLIFSLERDADVPVLRPRAEDPVAFAQEGDQWAIWHEQQSAAEREFLDRD